jgi:hypothetical protein
MEAPIERTFYERRMGIRRRADIDEIECPVAQQVVYAFVPSPPGTCLQKGDALVRNRVSRSDDLDAFNGLPPRQVAFRGNVSKSNKATA